MTFYLFAALLLFVAVFVGGPTWLEMWLESKGVHVDDEVAPEQCFKVCCKKRREHSR